MRKTETVSTDLLDRLRRSWSVLMGRPEAAPAESGDAAAGEVLRRDAVLFEQKLREALRGRESLLAGSVHVLGLNKLRSHFGPRWPAVSERVHTVVRGIIDRHLAGAGIVTAYGELAYVIVFTGLPAEMAKLRAAMIASEISRRLFGETSHGSGVEVAIATVRKDREITMQRLDPKVALGLAFRTALGEGALTPVEAGPGSGGPPGPGIVRPPEAPSPDRASPRPEGDPEWRDIPGAVCPLETAAAAAPGAVAPPVVSGQQCDDWAATSPYATSSLQFAFRPMWHVGRRIVAAHLLVPARVNAEGILLVGDEVVATGPASAANGEIDCAAIAHARATFAGYRSVAMPFLVVPVHYVTLATPALREAFLDACRALPRPFGERLFLELTGLPADCGVGRVDETVATVRPFCGGVLLRLGLASRLLDDPRLGGLYAAGFDVGAMRTPEKAIIEAMNRFAEQAARRQLRTYVHGLKTRSLASAAIAAGFSFVGGDVVATVAGAEPPAAFPFGLENLYEPLLAGGS